MSKKLEMLVIRKCIYQHEIIHMTTDKNLYFNTVKTER